MGNPSLNQGNPAYPFLQAIWPFKEGTGTPVELISNTPISVDAGSFTWTLESSGYGITLTVSDVIGLLADLYPTSPDITLLIRRRRTDATPRQEAFNGYAGESSLGTAGRCNFFGGSDNSSMLFDFGVPSNNVSRLTLSGIALSQVLETFMVRVNTTEIRMWRNGTDIGHTTGGTAANRSNNGTKAQLNKGSGQAGDNCFIDLVAVFTGALTDTMCANISADTSTLFLTPPGTGALALTGNSPALNMAIQPSTGSLSLTGTTPTFLVTIPANVGAGALALTGLVPVLHLTLTPNVGSMSLTGKSLSLNITLPANIVSGALVLAPTAPTVRATNLNILHFWNVRVALSQPLVHNWTVVATGLSSPLNHTWNVRNPMIGLNHIWRVIPNVAILGDTDVQKPTQQVTKTP